jgi:uncharacterized protein with HEPN domain
VRKDADRLREVLEAAAAIERQAGPSRERFDSDELVRTWCLHHVKIIGEAIARLSDDLRGKYPLVPWREIIAMRNTLVHGYFDVDWEAVWAVVDRDLAPLKEAIESILRSEGEEP